MASTALQIADALYAEDRDAKTLASRVAAKLESDGVTNLPLLTQENYATGRAPPGSLVRYVGMVQDMGNPEFYAPSVSVNGTDVCVAFRDELPSGADPSDATLADRKPFFCVAPPGLSAWASPRSDVPPPPPSTSQATKRPREESDDLCGNQPVCWVHPIILH